MTIRQVRKCAYCGIPIASPEAMRDHIRGCENHPLNKLTKLVARLVKYGPSPFEHPSSREYADAWNEAQRFVIGMGFIDA